MRAQAIERSALLIVHDDASCRQLYRFHRRNMIFVGRSLRYHPDMSHAIAPEPSEIAPTPCKTGAG
jgi:hypothetical protein